MTARFPCLKQSCQIRAVAGSQSLGSSTGRMTTTLIEISSCFPVVRGEVCRRGGYFRLTFLRASLLACSNLTPGRASARRAAAGARCARLRESPCPLLLRCGFYAPSCYEPSVYGQVLGRLHTSCPKIGGRIAAHDPTRCRCVNIQAGFWSSAIDLDRIPSPADRGGVPARCAELRARRKSVLSLHSSPPQFIIAFDRDSFGAFHRRSQGEPTRNASLALVSQHACTRRPAPSPLPQGPVAALARLRRASPHSLPPVFVAADARMTCWAAPPFFPQPPSGCCPTETSVTWFSADKSNIDPAPQDHLR